MKNFLWGLVALLLLPIDVDLAAQPRRPIPYPVIPSPQFLRAVEKGTRTDTGEPGPNYWTNTADYTLRAVLSPETRMLRGEGAIRYHNNSPDTLRRVYVHLRQNLHAPGAIRNRAQQVTGGVHLAEVQAGGQPLLERNSFDTPGYALLGTVLEITLPQPLSPGGVEVLDFAWSFEVPEAGAPRMGQDGEVFFLGYWYPQVAVYDDVEGWKADPYQGNGEFYMGYGTYDVEITLPEGWLIGATGVLQNPEEVLSAQTRERLDEAARTGEVVHVVTAEDRLRRRATADSPADVLTWRFRAENVRDFAFGASQRYVWDATTADTGEGKALIHALYRPQASAWDRAAEYGRFAIEFLSDYLLPYPYPHMTAVEGIIGGGMEYPMITLIGGSRTPRTLFSVTLHEIGHMWFPMIVGQDEKQFTWMDEGLTSFNTNEGKAAFYNENAWDPAAQSYYTIAGSGLEVESMRHGDEYPQGTSARGIAGYSKPAVALHALRGLLSVDNFLESYRTYARRWAYKHPYPYDLFNTFEQGAGRDLDWFWTTMFYETWWLDQAIASVEQTGEGVVVTIEDRGLSPFSIPLRLTYADGTVVEQEVPVDVWLAGEGRWQTTLRFAPGTAARVEIDPEGYWPDVDRSNNVWVQ